MSGNLTISDEWIGKTIIEYKIWLVGEYMKKIGIKEKFDAVKRTFVKDFENSKAKQDADEKKYRTRYSGKEKKYLVHGHSVNHALHLYKFTYDVK